MCRYWVPPVNLSTFTALTSTSESLRAGAWIGYGAGLLAAASIAVLLNSYDAQGQEKEIPHPGPNASAAEKVRVLCNWYGS